MTSNMSTDYSGFSALIQAAASQLGDLRETKTDIEANTIDTNNPTTPTLESEYSSEDVSNLVLDGNNRQSRRCSVSATVTPLLTSISHHEESAEDKTSSFPEILMHLLINQANENIVTFLPDGNYFAIRRVDFTDLLLYKHFRLTNFDDFLELIIKWGFIRVDGNSIISNDDNIDDNNINKTVHSNTISSNADIYVFRHIHFEMNQPVDLNKIKFRDTDKSLPQTIQKCLIEKSTNISSSSNILIETKNNMNNNSTKRQLSPSRGRRDSDYNQRLRFSTNKTSTLTPALDPISLSSRNSCVQPAQLRRRSSLELRGVAQDIAASKLHLHEYNKSPAPVSATVTSTAIAKSNYTTDNDTCRERRHSAASTLVEGAVETATQNIVTDAIEALLFDESHTRDTFMRHEKELSVSSLPGVVPISKQLFSEKNEERNNAPPSNSNHGGKGKTNSSNTTKKDTHSSNSLRSPSKNQKKSNGQGTEKISSTPSELRSSLEINTSCTINSSLEDASRNSNNIKNNTDEGFSSSNLRVIIPNEVSTARQQKYTTSMVVSPARMEAAALLVSQSRNRNDVEHS